MDAFQQAPLIRGIHGIRGMFPPGGDARKGMREMYKSAYWGWGGGGGVMGRKGRGAYVPQNDIDKICNVKCEVLNSSDTICLTSMSCKRMRKFGPIYDKNRCRSR